jgi:hypothetical protein
MAQLTVLRAPIRRRRTGLFGLADDFSIPDIASYQADWANANPVYTATDFTSLDSSSAQYGPPAPSSNSGSLSSSPINWNSLLPGLVGAGVSVFKTQAAADVAQTQAGYGIAPAGYTYRGQAYNVQSSYGSSMPSGYNPVYAQSPYVGVAQAQSQSLSSGTLLLLLGGAAIIMMSKKK